MLTICRASPILVNGFAFVLCAQRTYSRPYSLKNIFIYSLLIRKTIFSKLHQLNLISCSPLIHKSSMLGLINKQALIHLCVLCVVYAPEYNINGNCRRHNFIYISRPVYALNLTRHSVAWYVLHACVMFFMTNNKQANITYTRTRTCTHMIRHKTW